MYIYIDPLHLVVVGGHADVVQFLDPTSVIAAPMSVLQPL